MVSHQCGYECGHVDYFLLFHNVGTGKVIHWSVLENCRDGVGGDVQHMHVYMYHGLLVCNVIVPSEGLTYF